MNNPLAVEDREVFITRPSFTEEEQRAVCDTLASGWVSQGPRVFAFEKAFAVYAGTKFAAAVNSCTAALHLALIALGIRPGDEVIVPDFTFVATANAVEYVGARPILVDVDPNTFNLDIGELERTITPHTRAIIPVHLFGLCADMQAIQSVAERHGLKVVEDAACAVGATWNGGKAGTFGDAGCFSFHPRKILVTGEGGMVTTNDEHVYQTCVALRNHGATISDLERHLDPDGFLLPGYPMLGYNYRMTDIQAAIGMVQLRRLEEMISQRLKYVERYDAALAGLEGVRLPTTPPHTRHTYQSYVIRLLEGGRERRNTIARTLLRAGIKVRPGTHAVHRLQYYRERYGLKDHAFPNASLADDTAIALPLYRDLGTDRQDYVIEKVRVVLGG